MNYNISCHSSAQNAELAHFEDTVFLIILFNFHMSLYFFYGTAFFKSFLLFHFLRIEKNFVD